MEEGWGGGDGRRISAAKMKKHPIEGHATALERCGVE
jgi:hypothetical protein